MPLSIHTDSHTDHGIPEIVVGYMLARFKDRDSFFVETVAYPESADSSDCGHEVLRLKAIPLPAVPCDLHLDVPESECRHAPRGGREYSSRLCDRAPRMVREITIVAGPHPEDPGAGMVVFTMYGGPVAPQEPTDPRLPEDKRAESEAFWAHAALSAG